MVGWRSVLAAAAAACGWRLAELCCALALTGCAVTGLLGAAAESGAVRVVPAPAQAGHDPAAVAVEVRLRATAAAASTSTGAFVMLPAGLTTAAGEWFSGQLAAGWQPTALLGTGAPELRALDDVPLLWVAVAGGWFAAAAGLRGADRRATAARTRLDDALDGALDELGAPPAGRPGRGSDACPAPARAHGRRA